MTKKKIIEIKEVKRETKKINGVEYEVITFSNGETEMHALKPTGMSDLACVRNNEVRRIPFNPINCDNRDEYKWGDRE